MKDIKSLFVPIFGLVFLLVSAIATSDDPIVFFRTPAGEINQKSKDDGKLMLQIAKHTSGIGTIVAVCQIIIHPQTIFGKIHQTGLF